MRQEQAGNDGGRGAARESVQGRERLQPFPVRQHPDAGPRAEGFGAEPFTSGQRARWTLGGMVGRSPSMERLFLQMRYLAGHLRCALIEGERGTGKLLAARTLHELGPVRERGFVAATADEFLSGTNAAAALEQARGGTLYLACVDALNPEQQGRLLQLLGWIGQQQARGARAALPAAAPLPGPLQAGPLQAGPRALILSSRRALRPLVLRGQFRSDLHQQLSAVQLLLPLLRDRRDDIPMLLERFVTRYAESYGKRIRGVAQDALGPLLQHPWPENVRQLEDVVSRAVLRAEGEWLRGKDLHLPARGEDPATNQDADPSAVPNMARVEALGSDGGRAERATLYGGRSPVLEPFRTQRTVLVRPMAASPAKPAMQPQVVRVFGAERQRSPEPRAATPLEMRQGAEEPICRRPFVPEAPASQGAGAALDAHTDPNLDRAIMRHIQGVLGSTGGNKLRTARLLGISRSTLYRLLDAHAAANGRAGELVLTQAQRTDKQA